MKKFSIGVLVEALDKISGPMKGMRASVSGLEKDFQNTKSSGKSLNSGMGSLKTGILAVSGAVAGAAAGIYKLTKDTIDYGDKLGDTASMLGMSTKALQEYRYVAQLTGLSADEMDAALSKMTVNLGKESGDTQTALNTLGLTFEQLRAVSPDERLEMVAEAMAKVQSPTARAATTTALFGKSSMVLVNTLSSGAAGIAELRQEANDLGFVLGDDMVQAAGNADDAMNRFGAVMTGLRNSIGAQFIPMITKGIDGLSVWAKKNREMISGMVSSVGEFVGSILETVAPVADLAGGLLRDLLPVLSGIIKPILPVLQKLIRLVSDVVGRLMKGLAPAFQAVGKIIEALMPLVSGIVDIFGSVLAPILDALEPVLGVITEVLTELAGVISETVGPVVEVLSEVFKVFAEVLRIILPPVLALLRPLFALLIVMIRALAFTIQWLAKIIKIAFEAMAPYIKAVVGVISSYLQFLYNMFMGLVRFIASLPTRLASAGSAIKDFFVGMWDGIVGAFKTAGAAIRDFFVGIWDGIVGSFKSAISWIMEKIEAVIGFFGGIKDAIGGLFGNGKKQEANVNVSNQSVFGPPARPAGTPMRDTSIYREEKRQKTEVVVDFRNAPKGTRIQSQGDKKGLDMSMGYANVGF